MLKLIGVDVTKPNTLISGTDVIRGTIALHHHEGMMIKQDKDMLGSILDLNDVEVRDITLHRTKVDAINAGQPAITLVAEAIGMLHSRIPFYEGEQDNIIGILHVKDLVKEINLHGMNLTREQVLGLLHPAWFIPETTTLRDQLLAFRAERKHFACVIDEYGTWQGIVTLEDIIEEIVGNIEDEHDEAATHGIVKAGEHAYLVDGNMPIRDVNRQLEWELPDDEASTIAGLVMHEAKSIPPRGAVIRTGYYRITVMDKNATQIKRVRIEEIAQEIPDFEV
jgi:Mg2+/Co2+ transporter CorB